jgi:signal transduction histidine kinase
MQEAGIDVVDVLDWLGHDLISVDQVTRRVLYVSPSAAARMQITREAVLATTIDDATALRILRALGMDDEGASRIIRALSGPVGSSDVVEYGVRTQDEEHWRAAHLRVVAASPGPRVDIIGRNVDELVRARTERAAALALRDVGDAVAVAVDVAAAAQAVADHVQAHLRCERASVGVFDGRTGPLGGVRAVAGVGQELPGHASRAAVDALVARYGAFGQMSDEHLNEPETAAYFRMLGLSNMAFALIGSERERLGMVTVSSAKARRFGARELEFLRNVAERLAGPLAQKALDAERRHAAATLSAAQQRMNTALESSGTGVWEWHAATRALTCDATCAAIWELDPAGDALSAVVRSRIPTEDLPVLERAMATATQDANSGGRYLAEYRFNAPSGQKHILARGRCSFAADGSPVRLIGTAQDVSDLRRLEGKLVAAQKLESLGVLAGGIAHDFNNLLVGILGNAGLAKLELPPTSPVIEAIDGIETAALRASELTRQLLAYAGKARFVISSIQLEHLVQEMGHLLTAVIGKGVVLRYQFAHNVPPVRGDATQLRQVVMNLITNASDAIGERSGIITVATSLVAADRAYLDDTLFDNALEPGEYVCLQVSDTGAGMTAETRARIFEPFYTTKFTGRGLGLAAVQGILRAHRGALKVYSETGRGTTFKILLPAADGAPDVKERPMPSTSPTSVGHVLVIDDEETMRNVTRRVLKSAGISVLLATDGVEGLEVYRAHRDEIDLVLLDVTMPRMGGEETFRQLRQLNPNVRVLLSSGYSEQEATAQFAGKGLAGFIEKPFHAAVLLEKVRTLLRR